MFSRCPPAVDQTAIIPRTRGFPRDPREQHTVTRKTCVLIKNCQTRVMLDAPKPDTRNSVQQRRRKNTVNVKYSRVATFVRFPTKDVLKFEVKIEIC